jgi:hypothetical protein
MPEESMVCLCFTYCRITVERITGGKLIFEKFGPFGRSFVRRVGKFRQINNSAEDGIDGTNGYFRRNSGCSAEQKILGILFQTLPWKRQQLGIPFRGTKNRSKLLKFPSEPFSGIENNS